MHRKQLTHSEKKWGGFMYFKQKNKTAIRSQHMIADALFSLMKRKPFQQISVTEICEEAAIGRKTFYRNFELKEDVIDFQLDRMVEEYKQELTSLPFKQYLSHHFAFVQKNADCFIVLYQNGLSSFTDKKFSALLPDTMPVWSENPIEQEYRSAYIISGIEAIQRVWISRGCLESIDEVVAIAIRAQDKQVPLRQGMVIDKFQFCERNSIA